MMMSEFIERVGFEPTAAEYAEIEREYMGVMSIRISSARTGKRTAASSGFAE